MSNAAHADHPLTEARLRCEVSMRVLAQAVGCSKGHISRIEAGINLPSPDLANRISVELKGAVSREQLLFPSEPVAVSTRGGKPVQREVAQ